MADGTENLTPLERELSDSERLAGLKHKHGLAPADEVEDCDACFLLRLLDTTRSERDAALARVGKWRDRLLEWGDAGHRYQGECPDPSQPEARDPDCRMCRLVDEMTAALTPPEYPPEQPL